MKKFSFKLITVAVLMMLSYPVFAQEPKDKVPDGTEGELLTTPVVDSTTGKATNLEKNEANSRFSTFKIGVGYIGDYAAYVMDDNFKKQMDSAKLEMKDMFKTRDFRVLGSGKFNTKREFSWKFAFMYDGVTDEWLIRETGLTIGVPEIAGRIFIGRTKEGFSMIKVMNGHSPWGAERQMALDAVPILADGIKYYGYLPKSKIFWNLGYYNDVLSEGQGFSTFAWQWVARVGVLPIFKESESKVLHVAINFRQGKPLNDKFTMKSRPESNPAPFIINTGSFNATNSISYGGEIYYSGGRWVTGSEVIAHHFYSAKVGDHVFTGGAIEFAYLFTGAKRPYNTKSGNVLGFVPVQKSIFKGGWGEWELMLRYSNMDLIDGNINGGSFWRFTPQVNWYASKVIRMEFIYGYGILDRYSMKGAVQIYQARLQLSIL
jgi:phosphate-selective porin OprO/OprP